MNRDFDLIRNILFQVEKSPAGQFISFLEIDDQIEDAVVGEHLEIMIQENLIDGEVFSLNPLAFSIRHLTWTGQDFLKHARDNTIWKKVMAEVKDKGISITVAVLTELLSKAAKTIAGLE